MAWCPKCKSEYREGFTVCADCKVPLVESLDETEREPLCTFEDESIAEKFIEYLRYSSISNTVENNEEFITVIIEKNDRHKALMAMQAFVKVEDGLFATKNIDSSYFIGKVEDIKEAFQSDDTAGESADESDDGSNARELAGGESSDEDSEESSGEKSEEEDVGLSLAPERSVIFESSSVKADDSYSTGLMLITIAIIGSVVAVAFLKSMRIQLCVLFGIMFLYGIYSLKKSADYRKAALKESELSDSVQKWLAENIKEADLIAQDNISESDEVNYFKRISYIEKKLKEQFPDMEETFKDSLIDEFYETLFGENAE